MIRAVLFDAAGTLIETREPVGETYARYGARYGLTISAWRIGEAFRRVFEAAPPAVFPGLAAAARRERECAWWRERVRETFRAADSSQRATDFDALFAALWQHFAAPEAWRLRAGAQEALVQLRAEGTRTGVVSNFDHRLPELLGGLGILQHLEAVVLPADAGAAKPDPRIFSAALDRLHVAPGDALFVGDHAEQDLAGARNAGLHAMDVDALATLADLPCRLHGGQIP
ncbi:MAG: HAD-IA family hydrolase [Myxococcota bacterium]|nr:HAD-IA family hydrolase [Myxococcota bacterium]